MKTLFVLLGLMLVAPLAHADHEGVCSAERLQVLITGPADNSSVEFQSPEMSPTAVFNMYNYSPTTQRSNNSIAPWIGHSWGNGWNQVRYQTYELRNLIPGWRYHVKLKFWYKSIVAGLNFRAMVGGYSVSDKLIDNSNMGQYWVISFQATQPTERVEIRHDYASDNTVQKYLYLDYLEISEQPCVLERR